MNDYKPDYLILHLNNQSKEYEYNYFNSLIYKQQNVNYLCSHKGVNQLNIRKYLQMHFNYSNLKNSNVEIYYIVDNNYYEELVEEKDFNEQLVDIIYGLSIVTLTDESDIITIELLCKNENPVINFLNYKPGEQLLNFIFTLYENNKIIVIEPLNDRISNYYSTYKTPLIKLFNETGEFLFYGTKNTLQKMSMQDLAFLFYSFASIDYFKRLFNYDDTEINALLQNNMEFIKNELKQKQAELLNTNNYSKLQEKEMNQSFNFRIENLNYRNIDEILDASSSQPKGGKYSSHMRQHKTKKNKTKKNRTKKNKTKKIK